MACGGSQRGGIEMNANGIETRRTILRALGQTMGMAMIGGLALGQNATFPSQSSPNQNPTQQKPLPDLGPEVSPQQQERQAKLQNDERQKRLVADTEKLFQLASQLHDDVAKTSKNVMSVDVIRRADEIEKLARGIKERMRG